MHPAIAAAALLLLPGAAAAASAAAPIGDADLERCLCWDNATGSWCEGYWDQCSDYWHSAFVAGVPGALALTLIVIGAVVYLIACCCVAWCRCAAWAADSKCCRARRAGFPAGCVAAQRAGLLACLLALVACAGVGSHRASALYSAATRANDTITDATEDVRLRAADFDAQAARLAAAANTSVPAAVADVVADTARWMGNVNNRQADIVTRYLGWTAAAAVWPPALALLLAVLLAAACGGGRCAPACLVALLALLTVPPAALQVSAAVSHQVASDVCTDYAGVRGRVVGIAASELGCGGGTGLGRIVGATNELVATYAAAACATRGDAPLATLCGEYFDCAGPCGTAAADVARRIANGSALRATAGAERGNCTGACPVAECASRCRAGGPARALAAAAVAAQAEVDAAVAGIAAAAYPVADCSVFDDLAGALRDPVCQDLRPALGDVAALALGIAFVALLALPIIALGAGCVPRRIEYVAVPAADGGEVCAAAPAPSPSAAGSPLPSPVGASSVPSARGRREMERCNPSDLVYDPSIIEAGKLKRVPWHEQNESQGLQVTYRGEGYDGRNALSVVAKNPTGMRARLIIPAGAVLRPQSQRGQQNLVVRDRIDQWVDAGETVQLPVYAYCGNQELGAPHDTFLSTPYIFNTDISSQQAVWRVTNDYAAGACTR